LRINEFEWDDGNVLHIELGHGIKPEEAEEVFAVKPLFRKTKKVIMLQWDRPLMVDTSQ
jgi:hypothetical protein